MDKINPEKKRPNMTNKITPEKRNEYVITAMAWSQKTVTGDEEGALLLKKDLIRMEKELSMTAEQIMNSKPD